MHGNYMSIYTAKVYIVCTVRYMHGNYISIYTVKVYLVCTVRYTHIYICVGIYIYILSEPNYA
jgi:hypothetical protein